MLLGDNRMEGILTTEVENQNNNTLQIYFGTDKEKKRGLEVFPFFFFDTVTAVTKR